MTPPHAYANLQMLVEVQSWPYSFPESEDFAKWDERGNVSGRLLVRERCVLINFYHSNNIENRV